MSESWIKLPELMEYLRNYFRLSWTGIHGSPHWARVKLNGELLAASEKGARLDVIILFAFLHDHERICDGEDYTHGPRAAMSAHDLRGKYFQIDDEGFDLLCQAMSGHSDGLQEADITIQCCWDADRLDLWRIGNIPNPKYLCTETAKKIAIEKYWS